MTIVEIKNAEPMRPHVDRVALPRSVSEFAWLCAADDAAIEENMSGAPLPRAKRVTPANDSDILNLMVTNSSAGDRYRSAVDARL